MSEPNQDLPIKDVSLTPEMAESLKSVLGMQVDETFLYTPKAYRDPDAKVKIPKSFWPVFVLRGLDGLENAQSEDAMRGAVKYTKEGTSEMSFNTGKFKINTCKKGIRGWRNFRDIKGRLIPEPRLIADGSQLEESFLRYLSPALMAELSNAITEQSIMTEEELRGLE